MCLAASLQMFTHVFISKLWDDCLHVCFIEADSPPVALQGAQEQREDGKPGEAEEASGQEGGVLGQPPHALPQPGEVGVPLPSHTALTFSYGPPRPRLYLNADGPPMGRDNNNQVRLTCCSLSPQPSQGADRHRRYEHFTPSRRISHKSNYEHAIIFFQFTQLSQFKSGHGKYKNISPASVYGGLVNNTTVIIVVVVDILKHLSEELLGALFSFPL